MGNVATVPGWMYAGVVDVDCTCYVYGYVVVVSITSAIGMPAYTSYYQLGLAKRAMLLMAG